MVKIDPSTLSDEQRKVLKAVKDERDKRFRQERQRHRIAILILLIILMLLSIRNGSKSDTGILLPDFYSSGEELNAYLKKDQMEASQASGVFAVAYSNEVVYRPGDELVLLHYSNVSGSTSVSILQLVVHDSDGNEMLLVQSGLLRPGYSVDALSRSSEEALSIESGEYNGVMRIFHYDEDGSGDILSSTDIPVTVFVE